MIVGGSSEIGRAAAEVFAHRGLDIVLWGRDEGRLASTASACRAAGATSVRTRVVDVRNRAAVRAAAAEAVATGSLIAAVVWAAGVFQWGRMDQVDPDGVDDVITTSLTAAAVTARLFAAALIAAAPSNVIFIGSAAGRQAYPFNAAHVAAKHGLRGLAEALHLDLTELGVCVTTITAGVVNAGAGKTSPAATTHPSGILTPGDIARAIEYVLDSGTNARPTEITLLPASL